MNTAHQIINEVINTGAKFTLYGGEVGLTQLVNDDLLQRARKHKSQIKKILIAVKHKQPQTPKIWKLKIRTSDGKGIDQITMIDPHRMSQIECKEHLARQFGESRVKSFIERAG